MSISEFTHETQIFAVKTVQPWEEEGDYWIPKLYEELKQGRARFGWGFSDELDARTIQQKFTNQGWDTLSKAQKDAWYKVWFLLLKANIEDYLVYINMPDYGQCTIVRITGDYDFSGPWDSEGKNNGKGDFRHVRSCEFVATFNRNDSIVHPYLSRRLKLRRAWYRIYAHDEFRELLESIFYGGEGKTNKERLNEQINQKLLEISEETYRNFPRQNLEYLIIDLLKKLPNVKDVRKGPDVNGADIELEFEEIEGLQSQQLCAVQVKSYEGAIGYDEAIEDIKRAFKSNPAYTCGLIVSTALEMTSDFERKLTKLREETCKDVGLLIGKDLALQLLKYGID